MNLVELVADDQKDAPCKHGNIVVGHACYCHSEDPGSPRKCPVWREHGEDPAMWNRDECDLFEPQGGPQP